MPPSFLNNLIVKHNYLSTDDLLHCGGHSVSRSAVHSCRVPVDWNQRITRNNAAYPVSAWHVMLEILSPKLDCGCPCGGIKKGHECKNLSLLGVLVGVDSLCMRNIDDVRAFFLAATLEMFEWNRMMSKFTKMWYVQKLESVKKKVESGKWNSFWKWWQQTPAHQNPAFSMEKGLPCYHIPEQKSAFDMQDWMFQILL